MPRGPSAREYVACNPRKMATANRLEPIIFVAEIRLVPRTLRCFTRRPFLCHATVPIKVRIPVAESSELGEIIQQDRGPLTV